MTDLDHPGTLVDVEVVDGKLVVGQTSSFPPGTPTLTGFVSESTPAGRVPVVGAVVYRRYPAGGHTTLTDQNGFYELRGLVAGTDGVMAYMDGYAWEWRDVTLDFDGDTRFDIELVRN